MVLMVAEDGGLGIAEADEWLLCLWSSKVNDAGVAEWVCYREIRLSIGSSLPKAALSGWGPIMMGFAEEAITIFMSTSAGIYIIDLKSGRVKKVCDHEFSFKILVPIVSSGHTLPAPRCEYQYPPSPTSSEEEEADSYPVKEEEVVEKALERSHELFVKGRMAIEQPDFVNGIDCLSHALEIRAVRDGEHTPGCALLYKAQEEAVKSATSKAFAGNPKASGSTVECAPSLEQAGTEEGQNSNGIAQEDRKDDGDKYHDEMGGDENDSDLNLSWKMLNIARTIVEKSLGNTMGCVVSAPGEAASDAEGSSKSFQEDEIELRTGILAELNKLEDLEQAMTTPSTATVEIMMKVASQAEHNVDNTLIMVAPLISSQMDGLNDSFDSPVMPKSTTGNAGSSVTDLDDVGGGIRRANDEPSCGEPSPKRLAVAADDSP